MSNRYLDKPEFRYPSIGECLTAFLITWGPFLVLWWLK